MYAKAEEKMKACLQKDDNYLPALTNSKRIGVQENELPGSL
jgi:hypothetical protein